MGLALWYPVPSLAVDAADRLAGVQTAIQTRLSAPAPDARPDGNDQTRDIDLLIREFYIRRDFLPAWKPFQAEALVKAIGEADQEGLNPADYDLSRIRVLTAPASRDDAGGERQEEERQADLDFFLTETFLKYGLALSQGRIDPEEWFFQWVPHRRPLDLLQVLLDSLEGNDTAKTLKGLAPRHPSYVQMRQELAAFRRIAAGGGWPVIPPGKKLKRGDRGREVSLLKQRLIMAGDLLPELEGNGSRFDAPLESAIRRFQWRHGLALTGVVDPETRAAMNIPVGQRIRQMEINMERWRWLPDDFGPRYVMTIIPDLWLYVVEDAMTVMSMKTVIGTLQQPSPIFSDEMTYLELNPTWGLPSSIVAKEIIPKVRKDPEYLAKKRIRIYRDWSDKAKEIDPKKINWGKINPEKFPYRMIQDSGVNPLGRIKFMFPNEFDVYLHDTTQRNLFKRHRRLFSHGCIRLEKPYELGEWVLRDDPSWSQERLQMEIRKGKRLKVNLPRTVPVHVMYLTAWVDGNGLLQFRQDYYGYDKAHEEALKRTNRSMSNLFVHQPP
jgi:murein L,D-transpeptidase YcbB/YkuD